MGKASRAKKAIVLSAEDYFELMAKLRHVEVLWLEAREKAARLATEIVQKEIASAEQSQVALFDKLAKKYHLDAKTPYRFNDAARSLTPEGGT